MPLSVARWLDTGLDSITRMIAEGMEAFAINEENSE